MSLVSAYGHSQLRPLADLSPPLIPQPLLPEPVQLISTQGPEPFIEKVSSVISLNHFIMPLALIVFKLSASGMSSLICIWVLGGRDFEQMIPSPLGEKSIPDSL